MFLPGVIAPKSSAPPVADLAEGLWQRALAVAVEAAQATSTEADGQLSRLKNQLELRAHTLSQREIELDELLRSRERTLKELEEHLRAALSMLTKRDVTIAALNRGWPRPCRRPRITASDSPRSSSGP